MVYILACDTTGLDVSAAIRYSMYKESEKENGSKSLKVHTPIYLS